MFCFAPCVICSRPEAAPAPVETARCRSHPCVRSSLVGCPWPKSGDEGTLAAQVRASACRRCAIGRGSEVSNRVAEPGVGATGLSDRPGEGVPSRGRDRDQARLDYLPRIIGLGLGAVAVGSVLYETGAAAGWWFLLFVNGFAWPHLAFFLARRSKDSTRFEHGNLLLDSALVGLWIAVMQFNLLVSGLIAAMVWMNNITIGGGRFFLKGLAATAIGVVSGGLFAGFGRMPEPSLLNVVCSLPMLLVYPQLIGWWTNRILRRLHDKRRMLERLSQLDGLSGLNNRQYWEFLARGEYSRARRQDTPCSLLLLDIDRFKEFNDAHGHVAGDEVIRRMGRVLRGCVRLEDPIGRYGGEEFAVVLTGTGAGEALAKAETIRETVVRESRDNGGLTVSIGVAELEPDIDDFTVWVEHADRALYRAKALGRDRCMCREE